MASLAETFKIKDAVATYTGPTNAPSTQFTKLNFLNRQVPEGLDHQRPIPDVWINVSGGTATVGGSGCVQVPPNIPVEVPFATTFSALTEWGSARLNVVGVA